MILEFESLFKKKKKVPLEHPKSAISGWMNIFKDVRAFPLSKPGAQGSDSGLRFPEAGVLFASENDLQQLSTELGGY